MSKLKYLIPAKKLKINFFIDFFLDFMLKQKILQVLYVSDRIGTFF